MKRRLLIVALTLLPAVALAANKIYRYRCPKCGLVQEYDRPGSRKCPNDGRMMIRTN